MNTTENRKPRIALLDELRGLCVLLMVVYHGLYTLGYYLDIAACRRLFHFFTPVEPLFAGIFIFLCGLCCPLSHSNLKRGALLAVVAAGVSLVMAVGFLPLSSVSQGDGGTTSVALAAEAQATGADALQEAAGPSQCRERPSGEAAARGGS